MKVKTNSTDRDGVRSALQPGRLALACLVLVVAVLTPVLRAVGWIGWPWVGVLAPFTALGIFVVCVFTWTLGPQGLAMIRLRLGGERAPLTPPPDHLEAPAGAREAGDGILERYPELLAAICLGLAHRPLVAEVLHRSTTDAWGVHAAALESGPDDFAMLRILAEQHARRFAKKGENRGRLPSSSRVLKNAVLAFHACALKSQAGKNPVGCTFEHVTQMFGSLTPARDEQLKSIAPKVRKLLEREYPQLSTTTLADGSSVKYEQWRAEAARDRKELAALEKEYERMRGRVEEVQAELAEAHAGTEQLREAMHEFRDEARAAARAAQEEEVEKLRTALESHQKEAVRELNRFEAMKSRLEESVTDLTSERDELEKALLDAVQNGGGEDEDALDPATLEALTGLRVLLVGGHEGQVPPIRDHLESLGVQLTHADGPVAVNQVGSMHAVVLWIRFVSHPTVWAVKAECRPREIPCLYWSRTSPVSLASLIADRVRPAE